MPWLDALVQGLLLGGMYAQYALGMALMFGVMRIVNTAHGDLMVLLALMGVSLAGALAVGPYVVIGMLVPIAAVLGWLLQRLVLNRVLGNDPLPSLIATYGLSIALQNLMLQVWSADTRSLPGDGLEFDSIALGDLFVGVLPLQIFIAALLMSAGLDLTLRYTAFGRALRAASADPEAAAITGVDPRRVYAAATALAVGMLGVAAVCQSLRATVSPADGPAQLIYAFEAVIIGGMGSIWGAFLGAMVLGVAQAIGFRLDAGWGILSGHLVFLAVLAIRPQGLMSRRS
ncbi:branched-chain amino acid ABC transporter permease [Sphaerotilus montanus]|jgi:branched-chain amino acid transport system permease protein|uniref:Branched-chain amino acid transport system permease protein n=1 Tax=Sphaerotilus montanus TaxID=522889 RepID=A0A7Y9R2D1_9BURK|nr:branched-chain amino acid ABC transporter permease [Sphaerotilus montanus]NYG34999.1 branched-chain amino acid transport system permease protein [Sphaerotilus montanus]NZD57825.1 branched-chain amino acid ABC transporter permease [Sphaerotilus montanus]